MSAMRAQDVTNAVSPNRNVVFIAGLLCLAVGLLCGGLIGHFASKNAESTSEDSSTSGQTGNKNGPSIPDADAIRDKIINAFDAERIKQNLRFIAQKPHLAGSTQNNALGDWIENQWKAQGFRTKQTSYDVLLSYPGNRTNRNFARINNVTDEVYRCQEEEKVLDPQQENATVVPPFNAYAKSGTVKSRKVYYANYCRMKDFQHLSDISGVDMRGSIVICRYGRIFRGSKIHIGYTFGVVGMILYNDPEDYVYGHNATYNETFPYSWYLPPSGAQRGGTLSEKGDPLTPGFPAKDYVFRRSIDDVREEGIMPSIPTQPMGYEDAIQFMKELEAVPGSDVVVNDWIGGMNVIYKYGGMLPDNRSIEIVNHNSEEIRTISNVFGYIPGSEEPDRYVIVGNHRDAWMFGSTDPGSGTSIMMEMSRVLGALYKSGEWNPKRTILFASWDAEEYGIIGSWEWCDDVMSILTGRAVAYLSCDSGVVYNQKFAVHSSPLLYKAAHDAAKHVPHPEPDKDIKTLYDAWLKFSNKKKAVSKPHIGNLGSGSDYAGFMHKLGISSLHMYYDVDREKLPLGDFYPLYHTTYETIKVVEDFVDTNFIYHKALGQYWAEITRSLADSVILPLKASDYGTQLERCLEQLNNSIRTKLTEKNMERYLDHLESAINDFKLEAEAFDEAAESVDIGKWMEVRQYNDQLLQLERAFLYPLGILDRKYLRHVVFAPSITSTYTSSTFPGVRDSLFNITSENEEAWQQVEVELTKAVYAVQSATKSITGVTDAF